MATRRSSKKPLVVGAKVRFNFGVDEVVATIIEDRGPLGAGGVQIYRVRLPISGTDEVMEFEVPATEMRVSA